MPILGILVSNLQYCVFALCTVPEKDSEEDGEDDNDGEWDVHAVHQSHRGHTPPPEKGYCREASAETLKLTSASYPFT